MTTFQQKRPDYSPYGFTCELWEPTRMARFDHHNEVEINFTAGNALKYFFHDRIVDISRGTVCIFWGLLAHRVIDFADETPYYVITVPVASFLRWNLSDEFTRRLFSGEIIIDSECDANAMSALFGQWLRDMQSPRFHECMRLELQSMVKRMDIKLGSRDKLATASRALPMSKIQEMILFISHNCHTPISTSDIAEAVGLNADYAGALFRKTTGQTVSDYLAKERVARAQRAMLFSDDKITQIAYMSGFNSISNFNLTFKRISGCTPREYRNANRLKD